MKFRVHVIADAESDLLDIYRYVACADSPARADGLLSQLEEACLQLESHPHWGHVPPELERIGILDYREIHVHAYRIIYRTTGRDIYIYCVLDGRRNLQELLERRLLR